MLAQANPEAVSGTSVVATGVYSPRVPLLRAAAVQIGASLAVLVLALGIAAVTGGSASKTALAVAQGVAAACLARALAMDAWWLPIHALFVPGLIWMLGFGMSPLYPLAALLVLLATYGGVFRTRVPLFLSSRAAVNAVAGLLPRRQDFAFLDLGCGTGGVLRGLARHRPEGRYHGIEAAPVPFLLSWLRAAFGSNAGSIRWGNFHALDLAHYDVVYAYLSPAAMDDLWCKALREMRPGSLLISNGFAIPGVRPTATLATGVDSRLFLWRM
jgi:hypothetical protein